MDRSRFFVFFAVAMSVAAAGCNPDVHRASSTIDGAGFEFKLTPTSPRVLEYKPSTTVCRAAKGPCDQVEKCDGKSEMCPKDQLEPSTSVCRKSEGPCDVEEKCTGTSIICPGDRLSTKGSVCREAFDECDHPEYCSGNSLLCPQDLFKDDGLSCSTGQGACRSGFCVLYSGCAYPGGRPSPSAFTGVFGLLLLLAALFSGRRLTR